MSGLFRYPGGKAKVKDHVVRRILAAAGKNTIEYREPFWGAGVTGLDFLMCDRYVYSIWMNDIDVGVAALWTSVIKYPNELKEKITKFKPSLPKFKSYRLSLLHDPIYTNKDELVEMGFKKLAVHQMTSGGAGTRSKWPIGGQLQKGKEKAGARWTPVNLNKHIDRLHKRFSKMDVIGNACSHLDFEEVISNYRSMMLIYLDPPQYTKKRSFQHSFKEEDHTRLANVLKQSKNNWILSYNDCEQVRSLYDGCKIEVVSEGSKTELIIRP